MDARCTRTRGSPKVSSPATSTMKLSIATGEPVTNLGNGEDLFLPLVAAESLNDLVWSKERYGVTDGRIYGPR